MTENGSLGDYLFELRRTASPARLAFGIATGTILLAAGLILGPHFTAVTGLGLAMAGVGAWARLNQAADAKMDGSFGAQPPVPARRLRAAGAAGLAAGAVGALLFFYSIVIRFLSGATGM